MQQSPAMSWKKLNVLALTDSTGYGRLTNGKRKNTEYVHDEARGIFHVISPGAALSVAGTSKRLALAPALRTAPEVLKNALSHNFQMEVIFIKAEDSVRATKDKYLRMVQYRKDMSLPETHFTIMSLQSQGFSNRGL